MPIRNDQKFLLFLVKLQKINYLFFFLFPRYGFPISFVIYSAKQFTTSEFEEFLENCVVIHRLSAPYHPTTNGQAKRYVKTLKRNLKALILESATLQMKFNNFF